MPVVRINEPIADWRDGDFAQGYALVTRFEVRQDRKGRQYVDLEVADATGALPAKIWPDSPALRAKVDARDFVAFKGTVKSYRDQLQLSIDACRVATEDDREDGFDPALLIPSSPEDLDDLWRRLQAIYPVALQREELQLLAERTLERHGTALREHPAAKSIHHAYRGGLLEHVVKMAELALDLCRHYPEVDRDLVLLGVLFHDLGKTRELGAMPDNDYTLEGQLVGHIVIGHGMLTDLCRELDGLVPSQLQLHLEHLVLSHHGDRAYGSPIEPSTLEAFVLNWLDTIDSKLAQLRGAREVEGDGVRYLRPLGRSVYFDPDLGTSNGATKSD
ncbi:MAG: HD domain-containing protein [Acidobacteriota bacterium]